MSLKSRYFMALLVSAGAAASMAAAPIAAADTVDVPQPGSENASATIKDLKAQGYDVQINWVNGIRSVSLKQCWVNGINTAGGGSGVPTAYVDVECPR